MPEGALKGPPWYRAVERFLLDYGRWPLTIGLLAIVVVCVYFLWRIWGRGDAVPAAVWFTYLVMP